MTEEKVETVLDQFGLRRLYPKDRMFSGQGQRAACAVRPVVYSSRDVAEPLPGCCEFATGLIMDGIEARTCSVTTCFCPPAVFKDPKVSDGCSTRKEKLLAEQT